VDSGGGGGAGTGFQVGPGITAGVNGGSSKQPAWFVVYRAGPSLPPQVQVTPTITTPERALSRSGHAEVEWESAENPVGHR